MDGADAVEHGALALGAPLDQAAAVLHIHDHSFDRDVEASSDPGDLVDGLEGLPGIDIELLVDAFDDRAVAYVELGYPLPCADVAVLRADGFPFLEIEIVPCGVLDLAGIVRDDPGVDHLLLAPAVDLPGFDGEDLPSDVDVAHALSDVSDLHVGCRERGAAVGDVELHSGGGLDPSAVPYVDLDSVVPELAVAVPECVGGALLELYRSGFPHGE